MKYLEYEVKNMSIARKAGDKTALISGAVNYFGLHFSFDDEFAEITGAKAVEFYKNRNKVRENLVDGACRIPNELLTDKQAFEIRVISGNTIGTQWASVGITESGVIMPEEPDEAAPEAMEYVKTYTGDEAAPLLRATTNGLEYSQDGENWNSGVSGVPEVPATPKGAAYLRTNGDWVNAYDYLVENGGEENAIDSVKIDGVALPVENKSVNIDLSAYEKTANADMKYATKQEVSGLQTLNGTPVQLSTIGYDTTDTATIVSAVNDIILALQTRGVATV